MVEAERKIYLAQAVNEGKPEKIATKIAEGRMEKFFQQVCLLDQPFIREPEKTVGDLVREAISKLGENITVRRFVRFERGETL